MTEDLRRRMGEAAIEGAKLVDYRGVGTMEFLVDDNLDFYFMEMNTRIQVEHPVTEEALEVDLVQDQIRVALGEEIKYRQEDLKHKWVSIEARINAEDVEKDFRPTPGRLTALHVPGGPGVRVDRAVYTGYMIPPYYDSMIAKLIVKARTREQAIRKMRNALSEFVVEGVPTTIPFHQEIFEHPDFVAGRFDIGFLERTFRKNVPEPVAPDAAVPGPESPSSTEKTEELAAANANKDDN